MMAHRNRARFFTPTALLCFLAAAAGCRRRTTAPEQPPPSVAGRLPLPEQRLSSRERARAAYAAGFEAELDTVPRVAVECYRAAVDLDPGEPDYAARLGVLLVRLGRLDEGGAHLLAAERRGGSSFLLLQGLADYHLKKKRPDLAAQKFEKMLVCPELTSGSAARPGTVMRLALFLISHYHAAGRPRDAARVSAFLVKRHPTMAEFRLEHARHLLASGSEARALEEIAEFERLLPGSSAGSRTLAVHYSDNGLYAQALVQVELAIGKIRRDPGASPADVTRMRHFRADLLGKLRRYAEARKELRDLLAGAGDDGEKVDALVALAYLDRAQGKPREAVRRMQGAVASGMKSGRLYGAMAGALEDVGRLEDAGRAYRRALQLSPRDSGYRVSLARLLERRGRRPQAAAELRAGLRASPGDPGCSYYLGYLYALEGINLEEAEKLVGTARRSDPRNGRYMDAQGWVFYRQGRVEKARKVLESAVLRWPRAEAFEHLGDACFALGLWRRARHAWSRALRLDPRRTGPRLKLERIKTLGVR
jgi:tetratricopeptide (TPR) repeat protein